MVPHKVDNATMGLAATALGNGVRDGAAASGVIALLWRRLRPWYRRFMEAYRLMLPTPGIVGASEADRRLLQEIAATVEMIRKQVQPNGGASIPDSLRRVETELAHSRVVQQEMVSQTGVAMWQSSADGRAFGHRLRWPTC